MSTIEVAITPYVTVFAATDVADTAALMSWLNERTDAPEEVKWHRPWRVEDTEQEDDDTIVHLVGDPARWDLEADEWDDYDPSDAVGDLRGAFQRLPGAWIYEDCGVDAEDM